MGATAYKKVILLLALACFTAIGYSQFITGITKIGKVSHGGFGKVYLETSLYSELPKFGIRFTSTSSQTGMLTTTLNGDYTVYIRYKTTDNTGYFFDARYGSGTGYVIPSATTGLTASSGVWYLDGVLQEENNTDVWDGNIHEAVISGITLTASRIMLACRYDGGTSYTDLDLYEFKIHPGTLTPSQIKDSTNSVSAWLIFSADTSSGNGNIFDVSGNLLAADVINDNSDSWLTDDTLSIMNQYGYYLYDTNAVYTYSNTNSNQSPREWWVRPKSGEYGLEDGKSWGAAWDGLTSIKWDSISAGDTLHLAGTFIGEALHIRKSGEIGNKIIICGGDSTVIDGNNSVARNIYNFGGYSHYVVQNLITKKATDSGIETRLASTGVDIVNVTADTTGNQGFQNLNTAQVNYWNCKGRGNTDDGFSCHDSVTVNLYNCEFTGNAEGVNIIESAKLKAYNITSTGNSSVDLYTNTIVLANPAEMILVSCRYGTTNYLIGTVVYDIKYPVPPDMTDITKDVFGNTLNNIP